MSNYSVAELRFNKNNVEDQKQAGTLLQVKNIYRQEKKRTLCKERILLYVVVMRMVSSRLSYLKYLL